MTPTAKPNLPEVPRREADRSDDVWTIAAIAVIAFILADVAHEAIGHGVGYLLGGGRSWIQTTTRIIGDQRLRDPRWRILDLGGPSGNLLFAGLAWLGQRLLRQPAPRLRLLFWLVMAFSLFWGFGYLIYCGILGHGDWFALIDGTKHEWVWRVVLAVAGIVLYRESIRLTASELHWLVRGSDADWPTRARRLALISYVAGGFIACAGAVLDPHGPLEILNSGAASSFLAALGLLRAPRLFGRSPDKPIASQTVITRSYGWLLAAVALSIFFIAVLGPGVKLKF